jgi:hypothetical protein
MTRLIIFSISENPSYLVSDQQLLIQLRTCPNCSNSNFAVIMCLCRSVNVLAVLITLFTAATNCVIHKSIQSNLVGDIQNMKVEKS